MSCTMRFRGWDFSAPTRPRIGASGSTRLRAENRVAHLAGDDCDIWVAAERLPHFQALWPRSSGPPADQARRTYRKRPR